VTAAPEPSSPPRPPLSRDRVLRAAVALADRDGLASLTMRNLAQELGVEAMSLYHHVRNKEAVLDGVVEVVVTEINDAVAPLAAPTQPEAWHPAARERILTARRVLLRHPWAPAVLESRTHLSAAVARYFDGLLGLFAVGGFSSDLAHHALHALGSRALGFTQELFAPADVEVGEAEASALLADLASELPHLTAMLAEVAHEDGPDETLGWCDDQTEFEFGLDLLLDGLEAEARRVAGSTRAATDEL
jgi:AcrR family transcriptional regulator